MKGALAAPLRLVYCTRLGKCRKPGCSLQLSVSPAPGSRNLECCSSGRDPTASGTPNRRKPRAGSQARFKLLKPGFLQIPTFAMTSGSHRPHGDRANGRSRYRSLRRAGELLASAWLPIAVAGLRADTRPQPVKSTESRIGTRTRTVTQPSSPRWQLPIR